MNIGKIPVGLSQPGCHDSTRIPLNWVDDADRSLYLHLNKRTHRRDLIYKTFIRYSCFTRFTVFFFVCFVLNTSHTTYFRSSALQSSSSSYDHRSATPLTRLGSTLSRVFFSLSLSFFLSLSLSLSLVLFSSLCRSMCPSPTLESLLPSPLAVLIGWRCMPRCGCMWISVCVIMTLDLAELGKTFLLLARHLYKIHFPQLSLSLSLSLLPSLRLLVKVMNVCVCVCVCFAELGRMGGGGKREGQGS